MKTWHSRHPNKAITDPAEISRIVAGQKFLTLALCAENRPYIVTLSHAFDAEHNCFYFPFAPTGRKVTVDGISEMRFHGGRLAEQWTLYDCLGLLHQLGVLPSIEEMVEARKRAEEPAAFRATV